MDSVTVRVMFTVDTKHGSFTDALYFDFAEYPSIDQKSIDQQKQQRVDNWVAAIEAPPPVIPPLTKAEMIKLSADLALQVTSLTAEKAALDQAIAVAADAVALPDEPLIPEKG